MNYGNLLLQALLEHWWRPLQVDEDTECQGDHQGTGQTRGGNEYFSVPGHTPVIFRCILSSTKLHLNNLFIMPNVMVYSLYLDRISWIWMFSGFPYSLQRNSGIVPQNRTLLFCNSLFTFILILGTVNEESLNKPVEIPHLLVWNPQAHQSLTRNSQCIRNMIAHFPWVSTLLAFVWNH